MICKGCKIYMSIVEIDNQRFYWTEQLSRTNSELHQKIIYLGSYINILEKKITNLNEIILLKDVAYTSQCIEKEEENLERIIARRKKDVNESIVNDCLRKLRNLCSQLNNAVEEFQLEKTKFERIIDKQEKEFIENTNILHEMVRTYRESLFKEMRKYNNLKTWVHDKLQIIKKETDEYIKMNIDTMEKGLNEKIKLRYKNSIQLCNEQIKKQDELLRKMQIHRRELYTLLKDEKLKQNELKEKYEKNISDMQMLIKRLKQKNQNMETLVRFQ